MDLVRGGKRIVERRMFPGYLLVQVDLTDEVWHLIRSIPKVIGLVGRDKFPTALSDAEVQEILN
jgi:transcriptional antiterminator NusG